MRGLVGRRVTRIVARSLSILCVATLLAGPAAAAAEDLIVIESKNAGLDPGAVVPANKPFKLADGARLVLIATDGRQITLRGPFDGLAASAAGPDVTPVQGLLSTRKADTTVLGSVRDAGPLPELPDAWVIDPTNTGAACLRRGMRPILWRDSPGGPIPLRVAPADRSWTAAADWPAGTPRLGLPESVPVSDTSVFLFTVGDKTSAVTIHFVPEAITSPGMMVGWMAARGCDRQARALARSVG